MQHLAIGTSSHDKLREIRHLLADLPVVLMSPADLGGMLAVEEVGATFAENARLKALDLSRFWGRPTVADDSGLEVDALGGAPGVASRRFAGPHASDDDRNRELLALLAGLPAERRGARYWCAIAMAMNGRVVIETEGQVRGRIAEEPAGCAGFGYDPLFIPEGYDRTFGQLGEEVKQRISHRARALAAFKPRLAAYLGPHGDDGY